MGDDFVRDAAEAGIDGLIVVDLPPEEALAVQTACAARGLDLVYLLAPTSSDDRLALVAEQASGFVYCVSLAGVTGARRELSSGLGEFLSRVRGHTSLPLAVGFGISEPSSQGGGRSWRRRGGSVAPSSTSSTARPKRTKGQSILPRSAPCTNPEPAERLSSRIHCFLL
jgi:tryptophan synthase alpha subunit